MQMKKTMLCMMLGATVLATSCLSEDQDFAPVQEQGSEKGQLVLKLSAGANFSQQTRALNEDDYRNTNNYTVQLLQDERVLMECKGSEIAENLPKELNPGNYTVKAFYGEELNYSRDKFYVVGSKDFNIAKGDKSTVNVNCLPTCGKLSVVFDSEMATYYDLYNVQYSGAAAFSGNTLAWTKTDTEPWYVKLKAEGETLTYTINLTAKEEYAPSDAQGNKQTSGTVTGTFTLKRNQAHRLTVKPNYIPTSEGGLSVTIEIDDTVNEIDKTIEVPVEWI